MAKIIDFHSHFNQFPDWKADVKDFKKLQEKYSAVFVPIIAAHKGKKSYEKQFWQLVERVRANPDLFLGMGFWIDGNNLGKSFKLVKKIPRSLLKFLKVQSSLDKLSLKNKIYFKIVDFASRMNLPLYVHCTKQRQFVELGAVEKLVSFKPKVIKIIGHMGGAYPQYNQKALKIMLKYPKTYLDTSATFHQGIIEASVKAIGSKRILFGSDFPVLDFNKQRLAVANAKISKEDKQNILLNNAANLLRIRLG